MTEQERFYLFFILLKKIYFNEEKKIKEISNLGIWLPIDSIESKYGGKNKLKLFEFFKKHSKAGSFSKQTQTIVISFEQKEDKMMQAKEGTNTNIQYNKTMDVCQIKPQFLCFILDYLFNTTIDFDAEYTIEKIIKDFNDGNITFDLKKKNEQKNMVKF